MADIDALLEALTLEEKAALTAGEAVFNLVPVERLGIPTIRVTDGPAGAKWLSGPGVGGDPSTWVPCESAIGASWDPLLAERLGALVGMEALDRGCRGLLAPTVTCTARPQRGGASNASRRTRCCPAGWPSGTYRASNPMACSPPSSTSSATTRSSSASP